MTDATPKVGDKIRVSRTGVVVQLMRPGTTGHPRLSLRSDNGRMGIWTYGPGSETEIEILEPAYADGGIYVDDDSEIFRFSATADDGRGGWFEFDAYKKVWETSPHVLTYVSKPVTRLDA